MNTSERVSFLAFSLTLALIVSSFSAHAETPSQSGTAVRPAATIVFIGDSLTQGYGVRAEEAFPERIGVRLREKGFNARVINGGISGSLTAEADRRMRWYLRAKPDIVVLALGANDGLKGTAPQVIEENLRSAIRLAKASGIKVLLVGLKMLTNLGPGYVHEFEAVFPRLARAEAVPLIPFLLEGVALKKEFNTADHRHPNAKGHAIIAETVMRGLLPLLGKEKL